MKIINQTLFLALPTRGSLGDFVVKKISSGTLTAGGCSLRNPDDFVFQSARELAVFSITSRAIYLIK
jgi:hypothetical protein